MRVWLVIVLKVIVICTWFTVVPALAGDTIVKGGTAAKWGDFTEVPGEAVQDQNADFSAATLDNNLRPEIIVKAYGNPSQARDSRYENGGNVKRQSYLSKQKQGMASEEPEPTARSAALPCPLTQPYAVTAPLPQPGPLAQQLAPRPLGQPGVKPIPSPQPPVQRDVPLKPPIVPSDRLFQRCKQYASTAMQQVNELIRRTGSVPRDDQAWANDWNTHYKWCLSVKWIECEIRTKARQLWLNGLPPNAPSNLKAENITKFEASDPDYEAPGSGVVEPPYQISLIWKDNSVDEAGFNIYRWHARPGVKPELIGSVGPNVTRFVDKFWIGSKELFCYQIASFKWDRQTSNRAKKESKYSNNACSASELKVQPLPDKDGDGMPDPYDACPDDKSMNSHFLCYGCPDSDGDKWPEGLKQEDIQRMKINMGVSLAEDECKHRYVGGKDWGDPWGDRPSGGKGPGPPPGCPYRFSLRWMGMKILNNSYPLQQWPMKMHLGEFKVNGEVLYNEPDDYPSENRAARVGEEPYLVFHVLNGETMGAGAWNKYKSYWCCGEKVGTNWKKWDPSTQNSIELKPWEPDEDDGGEELKSQLAIIRNRGFQVFPEAGLRASLIDRAHGLVLATTLMERDGDYFRRNEHEMAFDDAFLKLAGCFTQIMGGSLTLSWGAMASGLKGVAELAYKAENPDSDVELVKDPDDYMGTDVWAVSRDRARLVTRDTGAYPFWIEMPVQIWSYCPGQSSGQPCPPSISIPATMQANLYFCLVREQVDERQIKALCSCEKAAFERVVKPEIRREIQGLFEDLRR